MDRYRDLALNAYIGSIYGGLLYWMTDFSLYLVFGSEGFAPLIQYPRYLLASILSWFFYTTSLPVMRWSIAKDQYGTSIWKLGITNNLFFSAVLPLATFTCTEGFGFWLIGPDPLVEKRFHTLIANGFCMTMLIEFSKVFDTYRLRYLEELVN